MRAGRPKAPRRARLASFDPRPKFSRAAKTASSTRARTRATWARLCRAQVRPLYIVVLLECLRIVGEGDLARLQHVAAAGDVERHQGVLLDEQDRRPLRVDLADDLEDPLDEDGREPHRRLVEEQQLR